MTFDFEISGLGLALVCGAFAMCLIAVLCSMIFSRRVVKARKKCELAPVEKAGENLPGVSVVIYCQNEAEALERLLYSVFGQEYDGPLEVIVVNDGESSEIRNLVEPMQIARRNLYLTNTPDGAYSLSRKKLALTLGIKAARYPVALLTTVDVSVNSNKWIYSMMRHFTDPGVEVVLGYAAPERSEFSKGPGQCALLDYGINSMTWLSAAIAGHPFRGTEYNLAYRRDVFFRNKGFSRSLNLHFGDDDIFVNEITNGGNTQVEISRESILGFRALNFNRRLRQYSIRRCFTEQFVKNKHDRLPWVMSICTWLSLAAAIVALVLSPLNVYVLSEVALGVILYAVLPTVFIARGMKALELAPRAWLIPFMLPFWPVRRFCARLRARIGHQKRFTWE